MSFRLALVASLLLACGDTTGSGGAPAGGGGAGGTSAGGSNEGGAGLVIECDGDAGFPTFDKACDTADDCVVRFHMVDCCGTRAAVGVRSDQAHEFDIAEAICETQYPGCGCAQGPTTVEDGQTTTDESAVAVECTAGECQTFLPP